VVHDKALPTTFSDILVNRVHLFAALTSTTGVALTASIGATLNLRPATSETETL